MGDAAVSISFGDKISLEVHEHVLLLTRHLANQQLQGIVEWIPTYTSVTVYYRPDQTTYTKLCDRLTSMIESLELSTSPKRELIHIPVVYGDEFGPDIDDVASYTGMEVEVLINLHSTPIYQVYMIGFVPGFPYMGGMDRRLSTPRLASPRNSVPPGSVGIAGEQTGVYPLDTPGGWRIIGRTPVHLYNSEQKIPSLLKAGDMVQFVPISRDHFAKISEEVRQGVFQVTKRRFEVT